MAQLKGNLTYVGRAQKLFALPVPVCASHPPWITVTGNDMNFPRKYVQEGQIEILRGA